jgi:SAM-dependent methyltransferase
VSRGFDRLAWCYAGLEHLAFGSRLQACRTASLDVLDSPCRVLVLGEGDGRFVAALRRRWPGADVLVVDASAAMVARARRRLTDAGDLGRVTFVVADALEVELDAGPFDVVVANFFVDCFDPATQARVLDRIEGWMAPGGTLLLGEFVPARSRRARMWECLLARPMHAFFRAAAGISARALQDVPAALRARGLVATSVTESLGGFLQASVWRRAPVSEPHAEPNPEEQRAVAACEQ